VKLFWKGRAISDFHFIKKNLDFCLEEDHKERLEKGEQIQTIVFSFLWPWNLHQNNFNRISRHTIQLEVTGKRKKS
jgi:hypothetical protein